MKNKKHQRIALCAVLLLGVGILVWLFMPHPIVADVSGSRIHMLRYNPHFGQESEAQVPYDIVEITDYDEEAVLACLSRYSERRTLTRANTGYSIADMELDIYLDTGKETKSILLGNLSHSYGGYGMLKHQIQGAEALRLELLELLDLHPQS